MPREDVVRPMASHANIVGRNRRAQFLMPETLHTFSASQWSQKARFHQQRDPIQRSATG